MTNTFTTNQTPSTGAVHMYNYIARLKTAGWTQQDSSDGTTRAAGQVTSGASGTNGLGNNSAWVRLQDPGGVQELTIQRGTTDLVWRMKYSKSAKFTGGSPSATVTPSATDEVILAGGGTDASPTFVTWFTTNNTYRAQYCADNASPYGSYFFTYPTGGGAANSAFIIDPIVSADGSDDNLYVFVRGFNTTVCLNNNSSGLSNTSANATTSGPFAKLSSSYVATPANAYSDVGGNCFPNGAGSNPFSTKDDGLPIVYIRRSSLSAPVGYKGVSTFLRWNSVSRTTGDTYTVSTSKDWINASDIRLPWDSSTTPLI